MCLCTADHRRDCGRRKLRLTLFFSGRMWKCAPPCWTPFVAGLLIGTISSSIITWTLSVNYKSLAGSLGFFRTSSCSLTISIYLYSALWLYYLISVLPILLTLCLSWHLRLPLPNLLCALKSYLAIGHSAVSKINQGDTSSQFAKKDYSTTVVIKFNLFLACVCEGEGERASRQACSVCGSQGHHVPFS